MTGEACGEMRLLVQADLDGELTPAEAAKVAAHLEHCQACSRLQTNLLALPAGLKQAMPYWPASSQLRGRIGGIVASQARMRAPSKPPARAVTRRRWALPFGAGAAVAACLVLAVTLPYEARLEGSTRQALQAESVVADHIRALQPGHLIDVVSTDQHTVKPWFDGRLDFAPPVKDLEASGFPLAGGRLDYLVDRPVAALVYRHDKHLIDLYVWPGRSAPERGAYHGYEFRRWSQDGMVFWAVADIAGRDLEAFVAAWQRDEAGPAGRASD